MSRRFIVVILDGFGIGSAADIWPDWQGESRANTFGSILHDFPNLKLPNLEQLGLMNVYGSESACMKFSPGANFGRSALMHYGADTFMGHQEIMGTFPKQPVKQPFQEKVDIVAEHLIKHGHKVDMIERNGLRYILCDDYVTIADNLEADPGMCYNVTAPLDFITFERACEVGRLVRGVTMVGRVIVFGGHGNSMEDLWNAEEIKEECFIGINSVRSGSYERDYHCVHLGYGINKDVQAPTIITNAGYACTLIGKVADIVANDNGKSICCIPTEECLNLTLKELTQMEHGFICTNIQETDLAGHSQSTEMFKRILEIADKGIREIIQMLKADDILLIQADHGNDPNIGYSRHTRECVPLLVYKQGVSGRQIGIRRSLSDVGATVCDYFDVAKPENGSSFLDCLL